MAKKQDNLSTVLQRAMKAIGNNFLLAAVAIASLALLNAFLMTLATELNGVQNFTEIMASQNQQQKQSILVKFVLSSTFLAIGGILLFGPLFAAIAVYIGRGFAYNKPTNFYGGINFAFERYSSLFKPYLKAQLSIQIGMIIIIPGILFAMQYAFVDAVACLEDEKHVLSRSKVLTKKRRQSLLLLILPWAIAGQVINIVALMFADNFLLCTLAFFILAAILFMILVAYFMLYEGRTFSITERKAKKAKSSIPERIVLKQDKTGSILPGALLIGAAIAGPGFYLYTTYSELAAKQQVLQEKQQQMRNKQKALEEKQNKRNKRYETTNSRLKKVAPTKQETPADKPETEQPKTEPPKTEQPKTDAPKTDAPRTESPETSAPKTDAPKIEQDAAPPEKPPENK